MRKLLHYLKVAPENYGLLATTYFMFFTTGLMNIMLGTLLPFIRNESALNYAQSGLMLSAHQFGNLSAVLIAGVLPYVIGRKKSTLLMGAGIAIGAVSMTLTHSPWLLAVAFAFTGIGRGTMSNICNVVIADVSGNNTGASNLMHAIYAIGALLSPVVVYACTRSSDAGWKHAAWMVAILAIIGWIFFARSTLSNVPNKKESGGSLSFFKNASFWFNTMILFFYLCAEAPIVGWFVIYFEDSGLLPAAIAKFTPTLLWVMIMIGRLVCATISSRVDKNKLMLVLSLGFTLCFAGMLLSRSAIPCVISLLGIGLSMSAIYPTTLSSMQRASSTVEIGFLIAIASVGGIIMPGIVGAITDVYGLVGGVSTVLAALAGMIILIVIKIVTANRQNRNEKTPFLG